MILLYIKRLIVTLITLPIFGRILRFFSPDTISFQGIFINKKTLTDKNLISIFLNLYESKELYMIKKYLDSDIPVIELGSSKGIMSCHIANRCSKLKVFVEANPFLINDIELNLNQNKNIDNYVVENAIINHLNVPLHFEVSKNNLTGRIVTSPSKYSVEVKGISLSSLVSKYNLKSYSLVMDIEGAEWFIAKYDFLSLENCKYIIGEFHDFEKINYKEVINAFVSLGFRVEYQYHNRAYMIKN